MLLRREGFANPRGTWNPEPERREEKRRDNGGMPPNPWEWGQEPLASSAKPLTLPLPPPLNHSPRINNWEETKINISNKMREREKKSVITMKFPNPVGLIFAPLKGWMDRWMDGLFQHQLHRRDLVGFVFLQIKNYIKLQKLFVIEKGI